MLFIYKMVALYENLNSFIVGDYLPFYQKIFTTVQPPKTTVHTEL